MCGECVKESKNRRISLRVIIPLKIAKNGRNHKKLYNICYKLQF